MYITPDKVNPDIKTQSTLYYPAIEFFNAAASANTCLSSLSLSSATVQFWIISALLASLLGWNAI